jgi:predicted ribosomally synthesized peptide with nif11-like leader
MSKQALDAFKTELAKDETLRKQMTDTLSAGGSKATASVEDLVAFAKTRGYDFSPEEVRETIELSDQQLDAVSGGALVDYYLKLDPLTVQHKDEIDIVSFSWGAR